MKEYSTYRNVKIQYLTNDSWRGYWGARENICKNRISEVYMYVILVEVIVGEGGFGDNEIITLV